MKVLLVEPDFPIPGKSKNHKNFLPIGLLKIGSYLESRRNVTRIELVRGNVDIDFVPDVIYVTSLFTYWSNEFWRSVAFYRDCFPNARIRVGGIYVSLMYDDAGFKETCETHKATPFRGVMKSAEKCKPNYSLLKLNPEPLDYQIVHASRGCTRECSFCGTWKIEPDVSFRSSIFRRISSGKIVFYDNNFLANPAIERILKELAEAKWEGKSVVSESQSGFDGRILEQRPNLAKLLKKARFVNPRIAWDGKYEDHPHILRQIGILEDGGFSRKNLGIFMLFNWRIPYEDMEKKRLKCWEWGVQVNDCRYRPLNQLYDDFDCRREQTEKDYFIHPNWTDQQVKEFRRSIRKHNICVRQGFRFHSSVLERKKVSKRRSMELRKMPRSRVIEALPDAWFPEDEHPCPASVRFDPFYCHRFFSHSLLVF